MFIGEDIIPQAKGNQGCFLPRLGKILSLESAVPPLGVEEVFIAFVVLFLDVFKGRLLLANFLNKTKEAVFAGLLFNYNFKAILAVFQFAYLAVEEPSLCF